MSDFGKAITAAAWIGVAIGAVTFFAGAWQIGIAIVVVSGLVLAAISR